MSEEIPDSVSRYCPNCGEETLHNSHWRCVSCFQKNDIVFEEGARYDAEELVELCKGEMDSTSGDLELVGDRLLGAKYGDYYLTFEYVTLECTDVTHVDEISELE